MFTTPAPRACLVGAGVLFASIASIAACSSTTVVQAPAGDGGAISGDAGAGDDAGNGGGTSTCKTGGSGGSAGSGGCEKDQEWSCGSTQYKVQCECPKNLCTCFKNGSTISTFTPDATYCSASDCAAPALGPCGFPTP